MHSCSISHRTKVHLAHAPQHWSCTSASIGGSVCSFLPSIPSINNRSVRLCSRPCHCCSSSFLRCFSSKGASFSLPLLQQRPCYSRLRSQTSNRSAGRVNQTVKYTSHPELWSFLLWSSPEDGEDLVIRPLSKVLRVDCRATKGGKNFMIKMYVWKSTQPQQGSL